MTFCFPTSATRKRLKQHPYQNDRNDTCNKDPAEARRKFLWKKSYWPKSKMAAGPIWSKYKFWYNGKKHSYVESQMKGIDWDYAYLLYSVIAEWHCHFFWRKIKMAAILYKS